MTNETTTTGTTEKMSPRDVFLQLWVVGSLYVSVGFFLALIFQYANYFFPDIANPYSFSADSVRWGVALLICVFPTHVYVMKLLHKDYLAAPEKRGTKLRKWLLYFTLFLAAIMFIVDVAYLVFYFLSGEVSMRFILKVLTIAATAGGVFWYYLNDLKRKEVELPQSAKLFIQGAFAVVVITIIGAFFVSGSPFAARDRKIDVQRVNDLQSIQSQILAYWQTKGKLPTTLSDTRDDIIGFVPPMDPETGKPYEYTVSGPETFALCATFTRESLEDNNTATRFMPPDYYAPQFSGENSWAHGAGKVCFERTIDKEKYALPQKGIPVKPL